MFNAIGLGGQRIEIRRNRRFNTTTKLNPHLCIIVIFLIKYGYLVYLLPFFFLEPIFIFHLIVSAE
jgi:hypothetical protein